MSELDKTIEELEAAVSLELEEAKAPAVGKGDSMEKPEGEVEDLGKAVVDPDQLTVLVRRPLQSLRRQQNLPPRQPKKMPHPITKVTNWKKQSQ